MYKLIKNFKTGEIDIVNKIEENRIICIPFNKDNSDYQNYLKWVEEGGIPEPADE